MAASPEAPEGSEKNMFSPKRKTTLNDFYGSSGASAPLGWETLTL